MKTKLKRMQSKPKAPVLRYLLSNGWAVLEPAKFRLIPDVDGLEDKFCRVTLPARVLRKVQAGSRMERVTTRTELLHALGNQLSDEKLSPKYWSDLTLWSLQRTGYVARAKDSYRITPKGKAWLDKVPYVDAR